MLKTLDKIVELKESPVEIVELKKLQIESIEGTRVGKLTSVKNNGQVMVDFADNPFGPLAARSSVEIKFEDVKRNVLLTFDKNDPRLPIIIGFIKDQPVVTGPLQEIALDKKELKDIILDGERVVFDAKKEIVLRCGKGSVTIRADGKIVIKGTNLLSRSKGMNKIKGAAISIN